MSESKENESVSEEVEEAAVEEVENESTEELPQEEASSEVSLLEQLAASQAKVEELEASFIRARADLDNVRRRAIRDKEELVKVANARIIEDLLPVLDNFELGFQSAEQHEDGKSIAEGFKMVYSQLKSSLEQHGLLAINPEGVEFNPNEHEAVSQAPSDDVEEGNVLTVIRVGYSLRGKLLRPATVIVSTGKAAE